MRLTITEECRFVRTPDNRFWVTFGTDYALWSRYLAAFDEVRVVARARDVGEVPPNALRVDGDRVTVAPLPYYQGPQQYLRQLPRIERTVRGIAADAEAVLLRAPSTIATLMHRHIARRALPYAMEVIGDPYAVFAPGVVEHPLRPFLRVWSTRNLRRQCLSAVAVSYETSRTLQARYPTRPGALGTGISSVNLPPEAYVSQPREPRPPEGPVTLVSVGSLEQLYKGIDTLIEALPLLDRSVRHVHIGPGRYQPVLERLATRLGVRDRVTFAGWIPTVEGLRAHLDAADLLVMPSRTEGLPRALIEAMARGLPAVASDVGGIPELLPPQMLFTPGDPDDLAAVLRRVLADPECLAAASRRNLDVARDFAVDRLAPRRTEFYRAARRLMAGDRSLPRPAAAREPVRHSDRPA
ncbi:glycosyltransferase [Micromonospora sp. WMMC241]|uniref:glycosyltransferase n=1 Tax=Micromonospora sp. WMMC241 TaxID=3015159 RepID=UPI0022B60CD0|nr:glycosyltransferase [Micromonospora sp. WMMC241]MCZ7438580.1 glycosyltransferase [Micromonospora sp. WMMC241]